MQTTHMKCEVLYPLKKIKKMMHIKCSFTFLADDSHEMPSLISSEKYNKKKSILSSAAVVNSTISKD